MSTSSITMWGRASPTREIMLQSVVSGDIGLIQSLLALDPTVLESKNAYGLTPLQLAIVHRHFRLAEYLIHAGINVTLRDNFGWTALHDAALYSSSTLVEILLQYGSNITARNSKGELPVDVAGDETIEGLLCEKMNEMGHVDLARRYRERFGISLSDFETPYNSCVLLQRNDIMRVLEEGKEELKVDNWDSESITSYYSYGVMNTTVRIMNTPGGVVNNCNYSHAEIRESNLANQYTHADNYSSSKPHPLSPSGKKYKSCLSPLKEKSEVPSNNTTTCSPKRVTSPVLPRRKVSVYDSPPHMQATNIITRSASFCLSSTTRSQGYYSPVASCIIERELNRSASDTDMRLTPEEMRRQQAAGKRASFPPFSGAETPIDLLKMRPRKPSIVDSAKRRSRVGPGEETAMRTNSSISGSRRSVSFQPEVLLQEVVTEGDAEQVKEIITSGIVDDLNKMSPVGLTALHQSALDGNLECARTLVLNGADVNSIDVEGWSPLHAAAANGHLEVVKFFLLAGANPNTKNDAGQKPHNVAKKGNVRKILFRAANGKSLEPGDESDGEFSSEEEEEEEEDYSHMESDSEEGELCFSDDSETASSTWSNKIDILRSMKYHRQSVVRDSTDSVFSSTNEISSSILLKERELSDSTSSYGSMTDQDLHASTRHQVAELDGTSDAGSIGTLMNEEEEGEYSDTDRETDQGFSTMDHLSSDSSHRRIACSDDEGTSRDVLDSDLQSNSLDYKFQEAILNGDVDTLLKLSKSKNEIEINRVNKTSGVSALHHSVLEENYTLVKHLVCDFKCDVNLKDVEGWTPLHAASAVGSIRVAQFLLENGAKASILNNNCEFPVDVTDEDGMSALLKKAMLGPPVGKMFKGIFR